MISRSALNLIWNIIVCIIHYVNLVTDFLTLRDFWLEDFHVYFWILAGSAILSWLLILFCLKYLPYNKAALGLLWLTHLDYAAWIFIDKSQIIIEINTESKDTSNSTGQKAEITMEQEFAARKSIMLIFQSVPSLFVTIHSIFIGNITQFIPQVSLFFSIIDISFNNAWLGDQLFKKKADRQSISKMSWKFMKQIIQTIFLMSCSNISFYFFWGILAAITRPLGALISLAALILIITAILAFKVKLHLAFLLAILSLVFATSSIVHVSAKIICNFFMILGILFYTDELEAFLSQDSLWSHYLWIAVVNMLLCSIYNCYMSYCKGNQQKKSVKPKKPRRREENLSINVDTPSITVPLISDSLSEAIEEKEIDQGQEHREIIEIKVKELDIKEREQPMVQEAIEIEVKENVPEIEGEEQLIVQEVTAEENS